MQFLISFFFLSFLINANSAVIRSEDLFAARAQKNAENKSRPLTQQILSVDSAYYYGLETRDLGFFQAINQSINSENFSEPKNTALQVEQLIKIYKSEKHNKDVFVESYLQNLHEHISKESGLMISRALALFAIQETKLALEFLEVVHASTYNSQTFESEKNIRRNLSVSMFNNVMALESLFLIARDKFDSTSELTYLRILNDLEKNRKNPFSSITTKFFESVMHRDSLNKNFVESPELSFERASLMESLIDRAQPTDYGIHATKNFMRHYLKSDFSSSPIQNYLNTVASDRFLEFLITEALSSFHPSSSLEETNRRSYWIEGLFNNIKSKDRKASFSLELKKSQQDKINLLDLKKVFQAYYRKEQIKRFCSLSFLK